MNIEKIIDKLLNNEISNNEAENLLKGYSDLGFAKLDTDRKARTGQAEVVFCQGKSDKQVIEIFSKLRETSDCIVGTRLTEDRFEKIKNYIKEPIYSRLGKVLISGTPPETFSYYGIDNKEELSEKVTPLYPPLRNMGEDYNNNTLRSMGEKYCGKIKPVPVLCAGTADIPVAEEASIICEVMGSPVTRIYDVGVAGLHRLLDQKKNFENANVIIACAGMEGALPSVVGGLVKCPVIAVPTSVGYGTNFGGLTTLFAMLNSCSNGISVVNIDNGFGAGYLANTVNHTNL